MHLFLLRVNPSLHTPQRTPSWPFVHVTLAAAGGDPDRDDPRMAEDVIAGADYVRAELFYAAQTEMVTKLDDFLRRRSKIALVIGNDSIENADGIHEACRLLFGDDAQRRYDEYFTAERREELAALRAP